MAASGRPAGGGAKLRSAVTSPTRGMASIGDSQQSNRAATIRATLLALELQYVERLIERSMYASRWLLAPIYLGLSLALIALTVKFFQEFIHKLPNLLTMAESDLVLMVLALVDMAMVGGLIVMVMFSGYENFVSKLDVADSNEKLDWMGKLDTGTLKQKVAASIVAISSIHLLQKFIGVEKLYADQLVHLKKTGVELSPEVLQHASQQSSDMLMWYVIIHMTFVASAFGMGYLDKATKSAH